MSTHEAPAPALKSATKGRTRTAEIEESKPSRTGGIPLDEWSGAAATKALHATMQEFVQATNQTSRRMVQLTWAIAVLTVMMLGAVVMQIVLALR